MKARNACAIVSAMAICLSAGSLWSADGVWTGAGGASPATAADWFDENNWQDGIVAEGAGATADLSAAAGKYIKLTRDLTITTIAGDYANEVVVIGVGTSKIIATNTGRNAAIRGCACYADVEIQSDGTRTGCSLYYTICGDVRASDKVATASIGIYSGAIKHGSVRCDLYANSSATSRTDFLPSHVRCSLNGYAGEFFYAPVSTDADIVSSWSQTAGSPYLTSSTADPFSLPVGAVVEGEGVPAGAFLRRIFPDGTIELSQAIEAGKTLADNALTFKAHRVSLHQTISSVTRGSFGRDTDWSFQLLCRAPEDEFVLEIVDMYRGSMTDWYFTTQSGYYPGKIVWHNDVSGNPPADYDEKKYFGRLELGNARIEFADPTGVGTVPSQAGWQEGLGVCQRSSSYTSYISVTSGVTALVSTFYQVDGTIIKEGTGTLLTSNVTMSSKANFVVEEGVFGLFDKADGSTASIKKLTVKSGATIRLSSSGLHVETLVAEAGARVSGGGILYMPEGTDVSGIVFENGAQGVLCSENALNLSADDFSWSPATPGDPLAAGLDPAFWVDASRITTLETETVGTDTFVTKWNDVRGAGHPFATNLVEKPYLDFDSAGNPHCIDLGRLSSSQSSNNDRTRCRALWFSNPIANVRAIFKVVAANDGGGQFGCGMTCASRREGYGPHDRIFQDGDTYRFMYDGAFFANGEPRSWREGFAFPYRGARVTYADRSSKNRDIDDFIPVVAEFHFAEPDPNQAGNEMEARVFGHSNTSTGGRNGLERIYECLIFTNRLTKAERQAIRGYLMKKWLNAEMNFTYGPVESRKSKTLTPVDDSSISNLTLSGEVGVFVADGKAMSVKELMGSGTLVKKGEGHLYIGDAALPGATLRLSGGTTHVRSILVTDDTLPGDPYLHMDASSGSTYTLGGSNGKMVTCWNDVRGTGHPTAEPNRPNYGPTVESVASLGGLSVLNFPRATSQLGSTFSPYSLVYDTTERLRTVVSVLGGAPGGVLAGYASDGKGGCTSGSWMVQQDEGKKCGYQDTSKYLNRGIWRTYGGIDMRKYSSFSTYSVSTNWVDGTKGDENNNTLYYFGPGATHLRIDGAEASGSCTRPDGDDGFSVISLSTYDNVRANAFETLSSGTYRYAGDQKLGETLVYTNTLSTESVKLVESYLSRKWFGRTTKGYRPAVVDALVLEGDAALEVFGGHPVAANALSVAPAASVSGGVVLAEGGTLTVTVLEDGSIAPIAAAGIDVSGGGTLVLAGTAKVKAGDYVICDALSSEAGEWTCSLPRGVASANVSVAGGKVVVSIRRFGCSIIVR